MRERGSRTAARPGRTAPLAAVGLGAGDGLLLIALAAVVAADGSRGGAVDTTAAAVAVLGGLTLLWGAVTLFRRMPIGRVLLSAAAGTVAAGVVVLLTVAPAPAGRLVDVVTGALLVGLQAAIVACALSRSTLLWLVGAPDSRRNR
jgi:hypothetical protein